MRRVAALMPTRGRAACAARALGTFLAALRSTGMVSAATVAVVDDSKDEADERALALACDALRKEQPWAIIEVLRHESGPGQTVASPGGGPGAVRNVALRHLRALPYRHDALVMIDDDVSFADVETDGRTLRCDGAALLAEALAACLEPRTICGCGYVGRQDLSILEHARLEGAGADGVGTIPASQHRDGVDHVAPGGISTAFLAVTGDARDLPDLPEHYNEDYVWLHAMAGSGWALRRTRERLVHSPPGGVAVSAEGLSFQIFGEIVWLAVLERDRYPVEDPAALADAVDEIVNDLRTALEAPSMAARKEAADVVRAVMEHYDAIGRSLRTDDPDAGRSLVAAIRSGLALQPQPTSLGREL